MIYFKKSIANSCVIYLILGIYQLGCTPNVSQPPINNKKDTQIDRMVTIAPSPPTLTKQFSSPSIQPSITSSIQPSITSSIQPSITSSVVPIAKSPKPNPIFRTIFPSLKYQTKIPILLPEYVPETETPNQVFAILEKSTPKHYQIMLAFAEDCRGGNACRMGSISGEEGIPKTTSIEPEIVNLSENIKAYFIPSKCGANCSDATLIWSQGEYFYTVAIKAGNKDTLIKIANSAIANGSL